MIEKEVKPSGNSGRVYLPLNWVGKQVKIIRVD
jgi:putative transposon-encoded protein